MTFYHNYKSYCCEPNPPCPVPVEIDWTEFPAGIEVSALGAGVVCDENGSAVGMAFICKTVDEETQAVTSTETGYFDYRTGETTVPWTKPASHTIKPDTGEVMPLPGFQTIDTCMPVFVKLHGGQVQYFTIENGVITEVMSTNIGMNDLSSSVKTRDIDLEFYADGADLVITPADILAQLAGGVFAGTTLATDDATTVYLNSVQFTLAHEGDEDANGNVSSACDASGQYDDIGAPTNLEPGGSWGESEEALCDVAPFTFTLVAGSIARACVSVSVQRAKNGDAVAK